MQLVQAVNKSGRQGLLARLPVIASVCILVLLPALLYRRHLLGDTTFIGNLDRLTNYLNNLYFHVLTSAEGHLSAWNEFKMLGFDTFARPYSFPTPLIYLHVLIGPEHTFVTAGDVSAALMCAAGVLAFFCIRSITGALLPSLIGAICYELSALSVFKAGQSDMNFAVIALIPAIMLAIFHFDRQRPAPTFFWLFALLWLLLHFTSLQLASYALLLAGAYVLYRAVRQHDVPIVLVFGCALVAAGLAASPRLIGVASNFHEYARELKGYDFRQFEDVYRFQNISPLEILRWFDDTIFGRTPHEAAETYQNNINLSEGFLLYTSSIVPFVIIYGALRYRRRFLALPVATDKDQAFFFWFMLFTFSVVCVPAVLELLYQFYFRMDFTHARVLVVGLLPLMIVLSLVLDDISQGIPKWSALPRRAQIVVMDSAAALLSVALIEGAAHIASGAWKPPGSLTLSVSSLARIAASGIIAVAAIYCLAAFRKRPQLVAVVSIGLWGAIAGHAWLGADLQVNGAPTQIASTSFQTGLYSVTRSELRPPKPGDRDAMRRRLESESYRTALICDPTLAIGFCAGHLPTLWRIRTVGGYYGVGVPRRVAALPFGKVMSLRSILFTKPEQIPWSLLSLLNVKYAVRVDRSFLLNTFPRSPPRLSILENPLPVVPRVFFVPKVERVADYKEAIKNIFDERAQPVTAVSMVEDYAGPTTFPEGGTAKLTSFGDTIDIDVSPSPTNRFLVVNELYFPGWSAIIDGMPVRIYPANAVMRGVVVPPGATKVRLTYEPFVRSRKALWLYALGFGLAGLFGCLFAFVRRREDTLRAGPKADRLI